MKFSAWYGIVVGVMIISQWTFSITSGGVPEFQSAPWAIAFHLVAEFVTALLLFLGGLTVLKRPAGENLC